MDEGVESYLLGFACEVFGLDKVDISSQGIIVLSHSLTLSLSHVDTSQNALSIHAYTPSRMRRRDENREKKEDLLNQLQLSLVRCSITLQHPTPTMVSLLLISLSTCCLA